MYRQNSTNVHSGTERPSQDKFDRFEAWLKENGAQFDLVSRVVIDRTCRFFACFLSRRWGGTALTRALLCGGDVVQNCETSNFWPS